METDKEFYQILHQVEFFRDFSREELDQLMRVSQWVKAEAGQLIISEGADDLYLFVLVRGQVNVVQQNKVLATIREGETFGEIGALARTPRSANVIAHTPCYCVRFEPHLFDQLPMELELKLVKKILFTLAARLTALNRRYAAI